MLATKFLQLAEKNPKEDVAPEALARAINFGQVRVQDDPLATDGYDALVQRDRLDQGKPYSLGVAWRSHGFCNR